MTETEIKEAIKKLDAALSGKPRKPRFRWNPARFLRAQEIKRQVDMIRRAEWARLTEARRLRPKIIQSGRLRK